MLCTLCHRTWSRRGAHFPLATHANFDRANARRAPESELPEAVNMRASFSAIIWSAVHAACFLWPSDHDGSNSWKAGVGLAQATSSTPAEGLTLDLLPMAVEGLDSHDTADWEDDQAYGGLHRKLLHSCHRPRCDAKPTTKYKGSSEPELCSCNT